MELLLPPLRWRERRCRRRFAEAWLAAEDHVAPSAQRFTRSARTHRAEPASARVSGSDADHLAAERASLPQNVGAGAVEFASECFGFQVPPVR